MKQLHLSPPRSPESRQWPQVDDLSGQTGDGQGIRSLEGCFNRAAVQLHGNLHRAVIDSVCGDPLLTRGGLVCRCVGGCPADPGLALLSSPQCGSRTLICPNIVLPLDESPDSDYNKSDYIHAAAWIEGETANSAADAARADTLQTAFRKGIRPMKKICFICLFCVLILCGCGKEVIWAEVGTSIFDLEKAAEENLVVPVFDPSEFHVSLDPSITPLTWLDEETVLCRQEKKMGGTALLAVTLDGKKTYLQEDVSPTLLAVSANGSVACAASRDGRLDGSVLFYRWNKEEQTLDPVYEFSEVGIPGFARCFNPSGTKAAVSWNKAVPSKDWTVRIVDLKRERTVDLIPPVWDTESPYIVFFISWLDDETLQVIARESNGYNTRFAAWECKPF